MTTATAQIIAFPKPKKISPWTEPLGQGIRRNHKVTCPASSHRQPGYDCDCPYGFWLPMENGKNRERVTMTGTIEDALEAKRLAKLEATERKLQSQNLRAGKQTTPTLDEWFAHTMENAWAQTKISSKDIREFEYKRLQPYFGHLPLHEITAESIEDWLHDLFTKEGVRNCNNRSYKLLSFLLNLAVKQRLIPFNPIVGVPYPKHKLRRESRATINEKQYHVMLKACRDLTDTTILKAMVEAGLRTCEMIELRWGDIHLAEHIIHIQRRAYTAKGGVRDIDKPKSGKTRYVSINERLAYELRWLKEQRGYPTDDAAVWSRQQNIHYKSEPGEPMSRMSIASVIERLAYQSGLRKHGEARTWITPHILRASGATIAALKGASPYQIQQQLGHAQFATTEKYLRPDNKQAVQGYADVFG